MSCWLVAVVMSGCTLRGPTQVVYLKHNQVQVQPGDTLASVALRHHVGVRDLAQCNGLKPPFSLRGVAVLTLPDGSKPHNDSDTPLQPQDGSQEAPDGPTLMQGEKQVEWSSVDTESDDVVTDEPIEPPQKKQTLVADASSSPMTTDIYNHDEDGDAEQPTPKSAMTQESKRTSVPKDTESEQFIRPVDGRVKRSFNAKKSAEGVDFGTSHQEKVRSVASGVVVHAGPMSGESSPMVLVKHDNGWISCYRLLGKVKVKANQTVAQGECLGRTKDCILRFDLRQNRKSVNPLQHIAS